jgi:hypothetical protein
LVEGAAEAYQTKEAQEALSDWQLVLVVAVG